MEENLNPTTKQVLVALWLQIPVPLVEENLFSMKRLFIAFSP